MAAIKIAQLTNQLTLNDSDTVIVETATSTNKMTVGNFKNLLGISEGIIVDRGSNANGSFIKFGDGALICYKSLSLEMTTTSTWGTLHLSPKISLGAPAHNFYAPPIIVASLSSALSEGFISGINEVTINSLGKTTIIRGSAGTASYVINLIIIGKWKS